MSSGVLVANPGSETGELLIGYPFSAVSTSQSTEQMTIKLRCYLGAGIYRPENVLILPHIAFEGLDINDAGIKTTGDNPTSNIESFKAPTALKAFLTKPIVDMDEVAKNMTDTMYNSDGSGTNPPKLPEHFKDAFKPLGGGKYEFDPAQDWYCRKIYRGYSASNPSGEPRATLTTNTGHLGAVDSLEYCNRVWGTAGGQIYKARKN